jgi:quercetin dioxygenase-like cupin family protein
MLIKESEVEEFIPEGHTGCKAKNILTKHKAGAKYMSIFKTEMDVNGNAAPHSHEYEQALYVIKGKISVTLNREENVAEAGTIVFIPPRVIHSMKNIGNEKAILLGVNAPNF